MLPDILHLYHGLPCAFSTKPSSKSAELFMAAIIRHKDDLPTFQYTYEVKLQADSSDKWAILVTSVDDTENKTSAFFAQDSQVT